VSFECPPNANTHRPHLSDASELSTKLRELRPPGRPHELPELVHYHQFPFVIAIR
jgi:hypothetical protein